jgi:hypothetical protein
MNLRRIVLGLGLQESSAAMALATELAGAMHLELLGLFVEDIDLLHFAALPFAREVCLSSATSRQLDADSMVRALQQRAAQVRRTLHRRLEGQSIQWAFEVVRGPVMPMLLAGAQETDLLVASLPARAPGRTPRDMSAPFAQVRSARAPMLLVRDGVPRRAPFVVLGAPEASPQGVAAPVSVLARRFGSPVVYLTGDAQQLRGQLARMRPGLVAVAGPQALDEAAALGLDELNCTLLLLPS